MRSRTLIAVSTLLVLAPAAALAHHGWSGYDASRVLSLSGVIREAGYGHPPSGPAWLVWLETSAAAVAMRQWTWLYPAVEIVHIVGFVTLVGAALMFDARLLGRSRPLAVSALERHLLPWARFSLLLVVPT